MDPGQPREAKRSGGRHLQPADQPAYLLLPHVPIQSVAGRLLQPILPQAHTNI